MQVRPFPPLRGQQCSTSERISSTASRTALLRCLCSPLTTLSTFGSGVRHRLAGMPGSPTYTLNSVVAGSSGMQWPGRAAFVRGSRFAPRDSSKCGLHGGGLGLFDS